MCRLFFLFQRGNGRDVVEILQRWPINYDAVGYGAYYPERMEKSTLGGADYQAWDRTQTESNEKSISYVLSGIKRAMANRPDVMVIDAQAWRELDLSLRSLILRHVEEGMGLVEINGKGGLDSEIEKMGGVQTEMPRGIPHPGSALITPRWFRLGDGSVALFNARGVGYLLPRQGDQRHYEITAADLITAFRWAAGNSGAELTVASRIDMNWSPSPRERIDVRLTSDLEGEAELLLTIFDASWQLVGNSTSPAAITRGESAMQLDLPPLPVGKHTAVVQLLKGGKVVDYDHNVISCESQTSMSLTCGQEL
ncbi:MAG: hypothetical protein JW808_07110, partial [Victivallales bacterium]|nr:hypothetical protein [Victivallales bacterium]